MALLILRWFIEVALCVAVLGYGTGKLRRPALLIATLSSFGSRLLVGEALYLTSALQLPLFRDLQLPGGLWQLGPDALGYDAVGRRLAAGEDVSIQHSFEWFVGAVYRIFGSNPSQALAFNATCAAACVPLGYVIARRAQISHRVSFAAAVVIGFWPSSFAWSGQVLKDPLEWLATFALLAGGAIVVSRTERVCPKDLAFGLVLLGCGGMVSALLRGYAIVGIGLGLIVALALGVWKAWAADYRNGLAAAGVMLLLVIAGGIASHAAVNTALDEVRALTRISSGNEAAAELAVWNARADIRAYFQRNAPELSPIDAMDEWRLVLASPHEADIINYAKELTGRDFSQGNYPFVQRKGPLACPLLAPLLLARVVYDNSGGASVIDSHHAFFNCLGVAAYAPRALEIVFLYPLPSDWGSGQSVGAARSWSALDALLLWLGLPGLLAGWIHALLRPQGANMAIAVSTLLLGFGLGFVVTDFGTLFRLRLEVLLPAAILAADGWWLLLCWLRQIPRAAVPARLGRPHERTTSLELTN